jgi:hypothetical protein
MHRNLAVTVLLLAVTLASARPASACKCIKPDLAKLVPAAVAVFVGKSIGVVKRPVDAAECAKPAPNRCYYEYTHKIQVEQVWKGDVPSTVTIEAGSGGGDCTFGDLEQERWLFVTGPKWSIDRCSGTQHATKAVLDEMTKRFGAPRAPKR